MSYRNFVTHLECANCGQKYDYRQVQNLCTSCNRPLWVKYDLELLKKAFPKEKLSARPWNLWRYLEMLPISEPSRIVSLNEGVSPLVEAKRLGNDFGLKQLFVKDESRLPSATFKARGMAMAISKANEFGIKRVAVPTNGNAGGAMAIYAARAGMEAYVFMPEDTPVANKNECHLAGARTFLVNGLISDCGRLVGEGKKIKGWFEMSTLKEPYRVEGKKTMGLELAEQMDWELPDFILYPTGGGTALIGMWKAFCELEAMGWLNSPKKPRMIACQSQGCAPIVTAFDNGERFAKPFPNAASVARGIRVPMALGDFMILDAVRQSGGLAVATPESGIPKWMRAVCSREGLAVCPESAVCFDALELLINKGTIRSSDKVVIFNTGAAQKYVEVVEKKLPRIDITQPVDWASI